MIEKQDRIGIYVIGTNTYFPLLIRFVKKFSYYYKGKKAIHFLLFTDEDPGDYLPNNINFIWYKSQHNNWLDGTNSKFNNIISNQNSINVDYLYYFDADTNIREEFTEEWFEGNLVGTEHFGNEGFMKESGKPFDKNPRSSCYIEREENTLYYHACFFGGQYRIMLTMLKYLAMLQHKNSVIKHEPPWNDESYINAFFNKVMKPTTVIKFSDFKFIISDKGGIENSRDISTKRKLSSLFESLRDKKELLLLDIKEGSLQDSIL